MTGKGPLVHLAILLVSLGAAWSTWTREQPKVQDETPRVTVWPGRAADVRAIELIQEKKHTRVERRGAGADAHVWVRVEREQPAPPKKDEPKKDEPKKDEPKKDEPKKDDAHQGDGHEAAAAPAAAAPAAEPSPPPPEKIKKSFAATPDVADEVFGKVAPLLALRSVGKPDGERKKEFGLDAPKDQLEVTTTAGTRRLALGGRVYGGSDRYALDPSTGEAFVVSGDVIRDLEGAEGRLMQRDLHGFKADDVARVAVSRGAGRRELVRAGAKGAKDRGWADPKAADRKDETASNWMSKLERLRVLEYVEDEARLGGNASVPPEPVLAVEYFGEAGKALGKLDLVRVPAEKEGKFEYYARTGTTRALVKLSQYLGEQVEQDVDAVLAAQ